MTRQQPTSYPVRVPTCVACGRAVRLAPGATAHSGHEDRSADQTCGTWAYNVETVWVDAERCEVCDGTGNSSSVGYTCCGACGGKGEVRS